MILTDVFCLSMSPEPLRGHRDRRVVFLFLDKSWSWAVPEGRLGEVNECARRELGRGYGALGSSFGCYMHLLWAAVSGATPTSSALLCFQSLFANKFMCEPVWGVAEARQRMIEEGRRNDSSTAPLLPACAPRVTRFLLC